MSRAGKIQDRIDSDHYPSPPEAIESFLPFLDLSKVESFGEPCRADGAIAKHFSQVPRTEYAELRDGIDYFEIEMNVDLIVTNPPFLLAVPFLEKSLKEAKTVAYLLRLNAYGSDARKEFWQKNPPTHQFTLSKRPSFVDVCKGNKAKGIKSCKRKYFKEDKVKDCVCGGKVGAGTDATEYAWIVWDRGGFITTSNPINVI